jgi:cystathionine beta-lyase/cystathionine gamma-synthase
MIDIEACAHIVHKHGDIILAVDNSFMSAYFQVNEDTGFFGMIIIVYTGICNWERTRLH